MIVKARVLANGELMIVGIDNKDREIFTLRMPNNNTVELSDEMEDAYATPDGKTGYSDSVNSYN